MKSEPLFIAPVDIKSDDVITFFLGKPALIERQGKEIWRDESIPPELFDTIVKPSNNAYAKEKNA